MADVDDWLTLFRYCLFNLYTPMPGLVMALPALITYSAMQCWRRKAGNILRPQAGDFTTENNQPPYHQPRVEHVHIHPEIYERNACGKVDPAIGGDKFEPEKAKELSVKTEVTQLTSIKRGDDDGAIDEEEGRTDTWLRHKQEMKKRRDWESIQRARARLCYAKAKVRPEEDTLYEVDDEEMPEVDFTAAFYAKLKAEQDKSDLC